MKAKIIRTSTVPQSLNILLKGQLKFLNSYFDVVAMSGYNKFLKELESREKVRVIGIEMQRKISPIRDFISLIKLYIHLRREKPTIVHSITPKAGLITMLAGKMAGVPIRMHTFTGLIFPTKKGRMQQLLIKMDQLLCWCSTHIYPEGEGVKKDLINYKITLKPLKVLANGSVNGVDLNYFSKTKLKEDLLIQLKNSLGIKENDFVFIFVGRLVGDKGINELVEVFSMLKSNNSKLLLVGTLETELDPLLPKTLNEIKENSSIISVGFQEDVRPYFAISNALAFLSYREGFPNVVMQAGAMELPSIVSDISGCNEIIIDGQNGMIVPVKDCHASLIAMEKLQKDTIYYNKLKSNARKMIESRYEQSFVWNSILQEYNLLLNSKK